MLCVAAVVTCKSWGYRITQLSAIRGLYSYFHCYNLDILKYKIIGKHLPTTILTVVADKKTYNNLWVKTSSFILGRPSVRNME